MAFRLDVLGQPQLTSPDGSRVSLSLGKPLALLVYVVCSPGPVSRKELADLFWPDAPRSRARHSLRQALTLLRQTLGAEIVAGEELLGVNRDLLVVDLDLFQEALAEGRVADAARLWRGPFLDGLAIPGVREWDLWLEGFRTGLELRFATALLSTAEALSTRGRPGEALEHLERALEVRPFAPDAHVARIRILLDQHDLDGAREALVDARLSFQDGEEAAEPLRALEKRLDELSRVEAARAPSLLSGHLELVGRSRELALLREEWRRTRGGETRVVLISGAAGIGKTRLAREIVPSAEADGGRVAYVKANPQETNLPLGFVADLVRELLRIPGAAGVSHASDALLRKLVPSLARSGAGDSSGDLQPVMLRDALVDLLDSVSSESPLIVILDDLPWADRQSRLVLLASVRRLRGAPCLVIAVGRNGPEDRTWSESRRVLTHELGALELELKPLSEEDVGELLAFLTEFSDPRRSGAIVRRLHRTTRGNPLFLLELLKEFREEGVLREEDGRWILYTDELPEDFPLPESIRTLLRDRLSRLSREAQLIVVALARARKHLSAQRLRQSSGVEEAGFTQAISELLMSEVCRIDDAGALTFTHDQLREAALEHLAPAQPAIPKRSWWPASGWARAALAAGTVGVIALGAGPGLGVVRLLSGSRSAPQAPYGGGEIVLVAPAVQTQRRIPVTPIPPGSWRARPPGPSLPRGAWIPFRMPDGKEVWYGSAEVRDRGLDLVRTLPDGRQEVLITGRGDAALGDLSPDLQWLVYVAEDTTRETFAHNLYLARADGSEPRLLYRGRGQLSRGLWSRDGDLIAFATSSVVDSVAVVNRQGERIMSYVASWLPGLAWCGKTLYALTTSGSESALVRISVEEGTTEVVDSLGAAMELACSPDGTALLYIGFPDGRPVLQLRDLRDGTTHRLSAPMDRGYQPYWIPDRAVGVPQEVRARRSAVAIRWGERRRLEAAVRLSDGSESEEGIRWTAEDPAVASIQEEGLLTGNRAGVTQVVAHWGYSFTDTVRVEVEDVGVEGALLRDRFRSLDTTRWLVVGRPAARIVERDGESVLSIPGDEKYVDGLVGRFPISLQQGATIEMEFLLKPNRNVFQRFNICLADLDVGAAAASVEFMSNWNRAACVQYPAQILARFDPRQAALQVVPGLRIVVDAPQVFPTDEWVHAAIQIRADGEVSLYLNHRLAAVSPVKLLTEPTNQWVVVLDGEAVGTELLVRNLAVWPEPRY